MEQDIRRALQINSAWLAMLAKRFKLDEQATRAIIRHAGAVIAETSLGDALDIADKALAPVVEETPE